MTTKTEMTTSQQPMMGSKEFAKLTGKRISQIHADIRAMVPALYAADKGEQVRSYAWGTTKDEMISFLNHNNIQGVKAFFDERGYVSEFFLDRRHTEILITGYDVKRRAAVIDRWFALESGNALPAIRQQASALPSLSKLEILEIALASEKDRLAEKERADHAERTKSQISRKREASALGKLGAATRKCNQLSERLGESIKHATITAVENATDSEYRFAPLRKWCRENNLTAMDVPDPRYGSVKSWPAEAWLAVYGVDLKKLFGGN